MNLRDKSGNLLGIINKDVFDYINGMSGTLKPEAAHYTINDVSQTRTIYRVTKEFHFNIEYDGMKVWLIFPVDGFIEE